MAMFKPGVCVPGKSERESCIRRGSSSSRRHHRDNAEICADPPRCQNQIGGVAQFERLVPQQSEESEGVKYGFLGPNILGNCLAYS